MRHALARHAPAMQDELKQNYGANTEFLPQRNKQSEGRRQQHYYELELGGVS